MATAIAGGQASPSEENEIVRIGPSDADRLRNGRSCRQGYTCGMHTTRKEDQKTSEILGFWEVVGESSDTAGGLGPGSAPTHRFRPHRVVALWPLTRQETAPLTAPAVRAGVP